MAVAPVYYHNCVLGHLTAAQLRCWNKSPGALRTLVSGSTSVLEGPEAGDTVDELLKGRAEDPVRTWKRRWSDKGTRAVPN